MRTLLRRLLCVLLQAQFYPLLRSWLASSAGTESRNNVIRAANGSIITSQLGAVHSPPNNQVGFWAVTMLFHELQEAQ
jgi:hypothetical protein